MVDSPVATVFLQAVYTIELRRRLPPKRCRQPTRHHTLRQHHAAAERPDPRPGNISLCPPTEAPGLAEEA